MHSTRTEDSERYPSGTRDVTSILDDLVAGIPTVFGKLVWISSLRVASSNDYRYPNLGQIVPPETASTALRDLHKCFFRVWLTLRLQEQFKDFTEYLETLPPAADHRELSLETFKKLVPPDVKRPELYLFETDLAVVLELAEM